MARLLRAPPRGASGLDIEPRLLHTGGRSGGGHGEASVAACPPHIRAHADARKYGALEKCLCGEGPVLDVGPRPSHPPASPKVAPQAIHDAPPFSRALRHQLRAGPRGNPSVGGGARARGLSAPAAGPLWGRHGLTLAPHGSAIRARARASDGTPFPAAARMDANDAEALPTDSRIQPLPAQHPDPTPSAAAALLLGLRLVRSLLHASWRASHAPTRPDII